MISFNLNSLASLSLHYPVFLLGQFSYHLGLPRPILFLWASSARFIPLGFLGPSHSFLLLTIPLLLSLLAFEPISFTNSFLWASLAHLHLLSTSDDSHGLTTSFFGDPLGPFAFFGALYLFCRPVYHYSCHSGLMVFLTLLILLSSPLLYCWASSCYWAFSFCQNGPQHPSHEISSRSKTLHVLLFS